MENADSFGLFLCPRKPRSWLLRDVLARIFCERAIRQGTWSRASKFGFIIYRVISFLMCQTRLQRHISWETRGNRDIKRTYQGRSLAYSHYVAGVEGYEMRLLY